MKIEKFDFGNNKTFIIAELSANHNVSIDNALKTIQAAKEIGADAIKLQTYTADTLTLDSQKDDFIIKGGTLWDRRNVSYIRKHTLHGNGTVNYLISPGQ